MSIKKKILVVALALGTLLGFGSGIAHMKMNGHCRRAAWQEQVTTPCSRGAWRHHGQQEQQKQQENLRSPSGPAQGAAPQE